MLNSPDAIPPLRLTVGTHLRTERAADWVAVRGRASVELNGGAGHLEVRAGTFCRLPAGTMTEWVVREQVDLIEVREAVIAYRGDDDLESVRPFRPRRTVS